MKKGTGNGCVFLHTKPMTNDRMISITSWFQHKLYGETLEWHGGEDSKKKAETQLT